jgi:hypothetical protein
MAWSISCCRAIAAASLPLRVAASLTKRVPQNLDVVATVCVARVGKRTAATGAHDVTAARAVEARQPDGSGASCALDCWLPSSEGHSLRPSKARFTSLSA